MKLTDFKKKNHKPIFTSDEAKIIAFSDDERIVNLELHQWVQRGAQLICEAI